MPSLKELTAIRGGNATSMQIFLIASTCILYLVAAGRRSSLFVCEVGRIADITVVFSKAVWYLEVNEVHLSL